MGLEKLVVLFLDCQTTGANPERGDIIEIGWARSDVLHDDGYSVRVNTRILKLPPDHVIPVRVQRITGITDEELKDGCEPQAVWAQILAAATAIAGVNGMEKCPLVIHFARFEMPFLFHLHAGSTRGSDFPFVTICTHQIAKRLFPDLPRRSIRAIAGYFGHSVKRLRRCKEHIEATALIWRETVRVLDERLKIRTLDGLQRWLEQVGTNIPAETEYPMSELARRDLPEKPGVYRMLRSNGDVIYVGKASSLRQRICSYFRRSSRHPEHILEMLSQAKQLDLTVTPSVLEAAILESDEIKRLAPPYNMALRMNGRQVWFCSTDFAAFDVMPTRECRIGPLVSRDEVALLTAISQLIRSEERGDVDIELLATGLKVPVEYIPDREIIVSGFEVFVQKHKKILRMGLPERGLIEIGRQLWLKRSMEKEMENDEPDEFELKGAKMPVWAPEYVCHLIESHVQRVAFEIRRARWFSLLSESSLCWEERSKKSSQRFLIVFENGQVLYRKQASVHETPVPPGYKNRFERRLRSFDLMTYDRMRVVTTEIRKIVSEMRTIELRLSPQNTLSGTSLARILKWI
jgi:DNA polymerase-3 subunit epsilon